MTEGMTSFEQWTLIWYGLGGRPGSRQLYERLRAAYSEPHRFYHTLEHIDFCLGLLDEFRSLANRYSEVAIALWFHDAVYDPRATDNEERSAVWVVDALREHDVDPAVAYSVRDMILATRHTTEPMADDTGLLVDIDLSVLGQSPEVFDRYDEQIRQEYAWVPDDSYRAARARVLRSFLSREKMYTHQLIRDRFQGQARVNLERALNRVTACID